jgi:long-chain acyl-CoA synthetase
LILDSFADQLQEHGKDLKYVIINSAPMEPEYVRKLLDLLPHTRVYMYYGLTEASRSSYICYNDHRDKLASVGCPTPGSEIVIGSPEEPRVNEPGEILIRGPHVTAGYFGVEAAEFFSDGWLKTGDLGRMDSDGFVTWEGRIKEQINVDGQKLAPAEVEEVLIEHDRVRDCAVVGAPDDLTGESVVGFVVPEGEGDKRLELDLRRLCMKRLEVFKIPKRILFVDAIPRTDSGKTQRMLLKKRLIGDKR